MVTIQLGHVTTVLKRIVLAQCLRHVVELGVDFEHESLTFCFPAQRGWLAKEKALLTRIA